MDERKKQTTPRGAVHYTVFYMFMAKVDVLIEVAREIFKF